MSRVFERVLLIVCIIVIVASGIAVLGSSLVSDLPEDCIEMRRDGQRYYFGGRAEPSWRCTCRADGGPCPRVR